MYIQLSRIYNKFDLNCDYLMQKSDLLIRTKLRPPFIRPSLVPRTRLKAQIKEGLLCPLTLITAPAGFGKTTLIAACVVECGMPVAWFSLDKNDNQVGRFLNYFVAALQEADNSIGSEAAELVMDSQQMPPEAVLTSLINDLDSTGREIAFVLDDYHLISNQVVHTAVAFLLEHCSKTFHLVIASRSDPPFPLFRLRARGQVVELRAADISFTEPEATQFLNDIMDLHLDARSIALLEERTEGWISGLQMAALSLRGRDPEHVDGFIQEFTGTNRFIMDFMLEEVLSRETEEVQAFLLQTSILNRLSVPLCDAVTGGQNGDKVLEMLESRNLFVVPLDDNRNWYRYHHLFADLLQARLYQSGHASVTQLLARAAKWCEREEQAEDAVGYALAAQDYGLAADLIEKYWNYTANNGEIETVWSWLESLPEETVKNNALLGFAYCWVLWLKGQTGAIEVHLVDAERVLTQAEGVNADNIGLSSHLAVLRSIVARYHNDFRTAVEFAEQALRLAPENLPPHDNAQLRAVIFLALGTAYDGSGDFEKAIDAYTEAIRWSRIGANAAGIAGMTYWLTGILRLLGRLRAADKVCREAICYIQELGKGRLPVNGILHLTLGELLLERNDLDSAEAHLLQGIELGKWSGRFDAVKNAAPALARIRQARHDSSGAFAAVEEAESAFSEPQSPLVRADLLALKARVLVQQGFLTEAARCVNEAVALAGQDRGQIGEKVSLAASRVLFAQGKSDETILGLTQFLSVAESSGRLGVAIEMRILRSLAFVREGNIQESESDLERALALAEPEGYVRVFVDEGCPMQVLLTQWLAHACMGPLRKYAIHLLSQFEVEETHTIPAAQEKSSSAVNLVDPLSQRELEVLQFIALGKTNQEIAQHLVVARGTIKAHAASIYRKLDATNRTEAVARARQLGILS